MTGAVSQKHEQAGVDAQVLSETRGAVAWVTLSHPGRLNAITVSMWRQLAAVMIRLSSDVSLRAVVIRGAGGHFAAGADIREFPNARRDLLRVKHYHQEVIAPALRAIESCVHPVVAQIEGVCVGGGLEVASCCDLRYAAASARFGVPIRRLGFPMAPDEMRGLLALVGKATTLEILLEGRVFDADEAFEKGLLTRVLPDEGLQVEVDRMLHELSRGAPHAARLNKWLAHRLAGASTPLAQEEIDFCFSYADTRDHREGVDAFLAGRPPLFTGE